MGRSLKKGPYVEEGLLKKIIAMNEANEKKALPPIRHDGTEGEYFSPEAVKSMSRSEIKKHYDAILRSMEQWS